MAKHSNKTPLNINLFGGPGTGKSTTAAQIFAKMKANGHKVELLQEYAKDLTYGKDATRLSDQLHILGEQHHRMFRIGEAVEYIVHDSPFVMGVTYASSANDFPLEAYTTFTLELFDSYNNLNIFLRRNNRIHPYQEYGRSQSLQEAIDKDNEIYNFLVENRIPFVEVSVSDNTADDILNLKGL